MQVSVLKCQVLQVSSFSPRVSQVASLLGMFTDAQNFTNACRVFNHNFLLVSFCRYFRESTHLAIFQLHIFDHFFCLLLRKILPFLFYPCFERLIQNPVSVTKASHTTPIRNALSSLLGLPVASICAFPNDRSVLLYTPQFHSPGTIEILDWKSFVVGTCLVHCRVFRSIPSLNQLDACISQHHPSCDNFKGL